MLEKQGKDAHHYRDALSVISFFKKSSRFHLCVRARTRTPSHCSFFVFCSGMFMCVALITWVCVTCESSDMSEAAPGMETR